MQGDCIFHPHSSWIYIPTANIHISKLSVRKIIAFCSVRVSLDFKQHSPIYCDEHHREFLDTAQQCCDRRTPSAQSSHVVPGSSNHGL